jgi:hypothetical protein
MLLIKLYEGSQISHYKEFVLKFTLFLCHILRMARFFCQEVTLPAGLHVRQEI